MDYLFKLENRNIFVIFISFLLVYGVFYRVIIPIIIKNDRLQGFGLYKKVHLIRFLTSLLFFLMMFLVIRILLKSEFSNYGIRLDFPLFGLILYIVTIPILIKYGKYKITKLNNRFDLKSVSVKWNEITKYVISWLFYITGYEMLYRGLLLYSLVPILGKWESITVVTVIYFFDHISRDYFEALGGLIIGFVFGYIVLIRNSVFESITLHFLIAVTTDIIILLKQKVNGDYK